jgi:NADH-quinone oxidoreductase subunit G
MIEIEIDGKTIEVEPGSMIIEVADKAGIPIPRFCYHKKLSIAANCRMCLVEVEKAPKPLPACATPVTAGMKVSTCSAKAKDAQRAVMEFLLINHPLDCPICDQGGECELQDISLEYGKDVSRFTEGKRAVDDDNLGSLIATEMTRCIQCTRCVRFGQEIAGLRELGATGRGENMQITTYVQHSMQSEISGNIIDLCPVGALTSKPFRFTARAWELQQAPSIAPHDCLGSNIYLHSRRQQVMRAIPRDNEAINETWLSDRDRFSYLAINSADRVTKPMVKVNGNWQETDWATALEKVAHQFKNMSAEQIAALISPSATIEELYLLQKLLRAIGCHNIDHRLHQTDFADDAHVELYPSLGISIEELETQDAILLVGANIQREQPLAAHRIRKATLRGARVASVNVVDYEFNFTQQEKFIVSPDRLVAHLTAETTALANLLQAGEKKIILLGAIAQNHPQAAVIKALVRKIAELSGAKIGYLTEGANAAGAWLAGAIPHRAAAGEMVANAGVNTQTLLAQPKKAYLLFGVEPQLDCANPAQALAALQQAEFVVACSPFKANIYLEHADVILPIAAFAETSGTFVNVEGRWQSFAAAVPAPDEARPGWKVLRVLGNLLDVAGFDYVSSEDARDELKQLAENVNLQLAPWTCPTEFQTKANELTRITEWPLYSGDSVVRRAAALQQSAAHEATAIYINPQLAARLQLQAGQIVNAVQGNGKAQLPVIIDARIPDACVWIPAGRQETAVLGDSFGAIEIYA